MPFSLDLPKDIRSRQKRRGPRMNSRVPVAIEWDGSTGPQRYESAFTRVVNNYGCLLVSPGEVNEKQVLRLTNIATRSSVNGVVVWKGEQRSDGWDLGVEFLSNDLNFWGLDL
jgi:hypothetical protein